MNDMGMGRVAFWGFAGKVVMCATAIWALYIIKDIVVAAVT